MLLRSLQERPNWVPTYRFLASCYAHMGRLDEARETIERVRQISLVVVPSAAHWRDPDSARSTSRACAWQRARRHEPDPASCRNPRR